MRQSLPHGGGGMVRQSWYPCQCAEPNHGTGRAKVSPKPWELGAIP